MDWGFIATIFLMVGFGIATIVLTIKLIKRKKPVWAYTTEKIIGLGTNAPRDLKLFFRKKPVTNVYRTTVIIFNKGEKAFLKKEVTKSITVSFIGATILSKPIVKPSSGEIKPVAKRISRGKDSAFELDFSYMDHTDGVVVEVLHTECKAIECTGNILEAGTPRYIGAFTPYRPGDFYSGIAVSVIFTIVLAWMWLDTILGISQVEMDWIMIGILAFLTSVYIYFIVFIVVRRILRYKIFPNWCRAKEAKK